MFVKWKKKIPKKVNGRFPDNYTCLPQSLSLLFYTSSNLYFVYLVVSDWTANKRTINKCMNLLKSWIRSSHHALLGVL